MCSNEIEIIEIKREPIDKLCRSEDTGKLEVKYPPYEDKIINYTRLCTSIYISHKTFNAYLSIEGVFSVIRAPG